MSTKPALDRGHIHASSCPQQLAAPSESRERLINCLTASKMQEHLGAHGSALRQFRSSSAESIRSGVP